MTKGKNDILYLGCRCLLGLCFILSAVFKFVSIDAFESYLFSFGFFGLVFSSFLSRILLFIEFSLGCLLITTIYKRKVEIVSFLLLFVFSLFLVYLIVIGDDGNCHCMGEMVSLTPKQSIVKNIVFFALLYLSMKSSFIPIKKNSLVVLAILLVSLLFSFVKLPIGLTSSKPAGFDEKKYLELESEYVELKELRKEERAIVCFFSVKCRHCKMAMRKLEVCLKKGVSQPKIQWIVWGDEQGLQRFVEETNILRRPCFFLEPEKLMPVTDYSVPLLLFFRKGELVEKMSNASFDEKICEAELK